MSQVFSKIMKYINSRDFEGLKNYLQGYGFSDNLDTVKCETCGEVVGLIKHSDLIKASFSGGDTLTEYLVFRHIRDNPRHEVFTHGPMNLRVPIGKKLMKALERGCEIHDLTIEEGLDKRLPYLEGKLSLE